MSSLSWLSITCCLKGGLPEDIIKSSEGESAMIFKFASSVIPLST